MGKFVIGSVAGLLLALLLYLSFSLWKVILFFILILTISITSILRSEYFEGKGWSRETALFYFMIVGIAETFIICIIFWGF